MLVLLKGKKNIDDYEDGEFLNQHQGVVFQGKNMKGGKKKYFCHIDDKERYSNQNLSSDLLRISKCIKNSNEDRRRYGRLSSGTWKLEGFWYKW